MEDLMRNVLIAIILLTLTEGTFAADQVSLVKALGSRISISKILALPETEVKYQFTLCQAQNCQVLGATEGYTERQIRSLSGAWRELGAVGLAVAETVGVVYLSATGIAIGAGFSGLAIVGGGSFGFLAPISAIAYIKQINPIEQFKTGGVEQNLKKSVEAMVFEGNGSFVIYQSEDLGKTIALAVRISNVLESIQ
jgi:hypothetical protein